MVMIDNDNDDDDDDDDDGDDSLVTRSLSIVLLDSSRICVTTCSLACCLALPAGGEGGGSEYLRGGG